MRSPLCIRRLRQATGMKVNELAAAAAISASMLSQNERGLVQVNLARDGVEPRDRGGAEFIISVTPPSHRSGRIT